MIDRLSGERIRVELFKTLRAPDPAPSWAAMIDAGVMAHTLPVAVRLDRLSAMVALERDLGLPPDPLRRLSALTGAPSAGLLASLKDRLKLSNRDEAHLRSLGGYADRVALIARRKYGQALYGAEPAWVRDATMLAHVGTSAPDAATMTELLRFIDGWIEPRIPVSGADLKAGGIEPGPDMGRRLAELERWWIEADFVPDRKACLAKLARLS